jgi:hypothetical protein
LPHFLKDKLAAMKNIYAASVTPSDALYLFRPNAISIKMLPGTILPGYESRS